MGVCRLQGNRAKCGTEQERLQRRRQRVLAEREAPTALTFLSLWLELLRRPDRVIAMEPHCFLDTLCRGGEVS